MYWIYLYTCLFLTQLWAAPTPINTGMLILKSLVQFLLLWVILMASVWLSRVVEGSKSVALLQTIQLFKYLWELYSVVSDISPTHSLAETVSLRIVLGGHSRVVRSWWCNLDTYSFLWLIFIVAVVKVMCMVLPTCLSLSLSVLGHVSIWPTLFTTWQTENCRLMEKMNCFWVRL